MVSGTVSGIVLTSPEGKTLYHALKFQFKFTNNEAEYEVVIVTSLFVNHGRKYSAPDGRLTITS